MFYCMLAFKMLLVSEHSFSGFNTTTAQNYFHFIFTEVLLKDKYTAPTSVFWQGMSSADFDSEILTEMETFYIFTLQFTICS